MSDDINDFLPSILNPRSVRKQNESLTQDSVVSRCSLSLRRRKLPRNLNQAVPAQKQQFHQSQPSFSRNFGSKNTFSPKHKVLLDLEKDKENYNKEQNASCTVTTQRLAFLTDNELANASTVDLLSLADLNKSSEQATLKSNDYMPYWDGQNQYLANRRSRTSVDFTIFEDLPQRSRVDDAKINNNRQGNESDETLAYDIKEQSNISVSFGINNCDCVDVTTNKSNIKNIRVSHKDNDVTVDCDLIECVTLSTESEFDENMNETSPNPQKRSGVAVSLEIKKKKLSPEGGVENAKVLILKTDAIKKLSHVIVQPPNYKLVKRHILDRNKFQNRQNTAIGKANNGKSGTGVNLRQISIDSYIAKDNKYSKSRNGHTEGVGLVSDAPEMSKNLGVADAIKCDVFGRNPYKTDWKDDVPARSVRASTGRSEIPSPKRQDFKGSSIEGPRSDASRSPLPRVRINSGSSNSPRKVADSGQLGVTGKPKSNRTSGSARHIPHYKIVAGTHFAVDAFCYGDIPNVKHYFLTHFHSDHYSGLKKTFNKLLYCSKITGDLCVSRLGVNPKCIHVLAMEVSSRIESVEVTAVDANHCPGAVMFVFGLPNGKTILHTGDFRASPSMESYPLFWNKDIHTVYLDTTYCNPRYNFPTQDESLEIALTLLRQKKLALEKANKKFSSVLIVCGTYTIGKEKFFLGMSRRVGCSVWACPEKDKVLQAVEGRSFSLAPPQSCQLHVVPMRDLSHDKLKSYLDTLNGAFSEVVAFKPSGWENGKNSTVEKNSVTIHGIPYSEHSSFSELIRFVKYLKPKQVVPTVDISGGIKAVQKYFPCPLVYKEDTMNQSKVTEYFSIQGRQQAAAVT